MKINSLMLKGANENPNAAPDGHSNSETKKSKQMKRVTMYYKKSLEKRDRRDSKLSKS